MTSIPECNVPEKKVIYVLRWKSRHFYVGSTKDFKTRLSQHRRSCYSSRPSNKYMSRVWLRHGPPAHYILMEVPADKAFKWEQLFLDILSVEKYCLNINTETKRPNKWKRNKLFSKVNKH
jgi:hypothetical protein